MNTSLKIFLMTLVLCMLTATALAESLPPGGWVKESALQTGDSIEFPTDFTKSPDLGPGSLPTTSSMAPTAASPADSRAPTVATAPPTQAVLETASGGTNHPPKIIDLLKDVEGPCRPGAVVTWAAEASDPEGDTVLYQFWQNGPSTGNSWRAMTNWSEDGSWSWPTSASDAGSSIIAVRVRDQYHAPIDGWDDIMTAEYIVQSGSQGRIPAITGLRSDKQSPQPQGAKVTWTGEASDPDGDPVLYQFWIKGPSTQEEWTPVTPWTTTNTWMWNSIQAGTGIYLVELRVRDGYHAGPGASDDNTRAVFVIRQFVK